MRAELLLHQRLCLTEPSFYFTDASSIPSLPPTRRKLRPTFVNRVDVDMAFFRPARSVDKVLEASEGKHECHLHGRRDTEI